MVSAVRAFLGLGSNLGDRRAHLEAAVAGLADVVRVSPVYETDPVGGPPGQGPYLNAVVELATDRSPRELLATARRLEAAADRRRVEHHGPRTLDVDVLLVGDLRVHDEDLVVPHPRMWQRAFVLVPLHDLAPDLVPEQPDDPGVRPAGSLRLWTRTAPGAGPERRRGALQLINTVEAFRRALVHERAGGRRVGLVPTMGALHAGHRSLVDRAVVECDAVAVTVFVNPLQFGPTEDLTTYPRDLEGDRDVVEQAGADYLFAPPADEMFPEPPRTTVHVTGVSEGREGASRPGHLDGVATVVTKLLAIAGDCRAYFGEKDHQQLEVVRRLVADLSLPVDVVACPTVRAPDGLALSSRNARLSDEERAAAPVLHRALVAGATRLAAGPAGPEEVAAAMAAVVGAEPLAVLDYAEAVPGQWSWRLYVAARVGAVRLIDNLAAPAGPA